MDDVADTLAEVKSDLVSLIKFWVVIEGENRLQSQWIERLRIFDGQLENIKSKGLNSCSKIINVIDRTFDWSSYDEGYGFTFEEMLDKSPRACASVVNDVYEDYQEFRNYMNETRELKIRYPGVSISRGDREEIVKFKLTELSKALDEGSKPERKLERRNKDIDYLFKRMYERLEWEKKIGKICHLCEYKKGGELVEGCEDIKSNQIPYSLLQSVHSFGIHDMCDFREVRNRSVVIPAKLAFDNSSVELGTVNLRELFGAKNLDDYLTVFNTSMEPLFHFIILFLFYLFFVMRRPGEQTIGFTFFIGRLSTRIFVIFFYGNPYYILFFKRSQ